MSIAMRAARLVRYLGGALVVLVLIAAFWSSQSPPTPWIETQSSDPAPRFTLETLDGDTFRMAEHENEVVVVNFWATWCPPCRKEIPEFMKLQQSMGDDGVQVVGISLDQGGPDPVRRFATNMDINYPIGIDDGHIASAFGGVQSLPTTYIIGPDGQIRGHIPGLATAEMLRPGLQTLLDEAGEDDV